MMVVIFFFAIFLVVIVINRIDFSIDTSSKAYQHEVARKKAEYYIESIGELFDVGFFLPGGGGCFGNRKGW